MTATKPCGVSVSGAYDKLRALRDALQSPSVECSEAGDAEMGRLETIVETGEAVTASDLMAKAWWLLDQVSADIPINPALVVTMVDALERLIPPSSVPSFET